MNARIKERIEQINSGIVPEGYQKTAFGIFPCDWLKVSLGEVSSKKGEYGLNAPACEYAEGLPKYLRITDIDEQGCYIDNNAYVNDTDSNKYILGKGDIVFARTGASVGKNYIYNEKDGILVYAGFLIKFSIKPQYNAYLICLNCRTKKYDNWVAKMCARSGQPGINAEEYATYSCIIPKSTQEQARIAEILMQWDKAIELQGKLVEAYQKLKKYCLNKMFPKQGSNVPEIRFPGFTAPWEQCKFAEVYSFASEGGTPDTNTDAYYRNGTIPFVRIEDTENKYIDSVKTFITEEGLKHSSAWLIPSDSVIFTNGATVGNVAINRIPVATKQGILGIIPNKTVTAEYLYYLLSSGFFQREVRNRQATGTFATIILKNLNEINVFVPDKAEQQKISGYLSSIDNLITLHQKKREKLMAQRKVLQQYLLTGIVRV